MIIRVVYSAYSHLLLSLIMNLFKSRLLCFNYVLISQLHLTIRFCLSFNECPITVIKTYFFQMRILTILLLSVNYEANNFLGHIFM